MVKKVMTAAEVAAYLHFNISTVYRMARDGLIPAVRANNAWRFSRDAIDLWLRLKSEEHYMGSLEASAGTLESVEFSSFELGIRSDLSKEAFYEG